MLSNYLSDMVSSTKVHVSKTDTEMYIFLDFCITNADFYKWFLESILFSIIRPFSARKIRKVCIFIYHYNMYLCYNM